MEGFIDQIKTPKGGRTLYDVLVERWNALKRPARSTRAAECKTKGHDWAALSWGPSVCRRCLTYSREDE